MATAVHIPQTRPMVVADLASLPADVRAELVEGQLVMMSPTKHNHGTVVARLMAVVNPWVYGRSLGEVYPESVGFVLRRNPDVVRCPDLAFVSAARLPVVRDDGFLEIGPDLAVEVLSPSNSFPEITRRLADFFAAGTRLAWVFDPEARSVAVALPTSPEHWSWLGEGDTLDGGDVLPGLRVDITFCFAGVRGRPPGSPPTE